MEWVQAEARTMKFQRSLPTPSSKQRQQHHCSQTTHLPMSLTYIVWVSSRRNQAFFQWPEQDIGDFQPTSNLRGPFCATGSNPLSQLLDIHAYNIHLLCGIDFSTSYITVANTMEPDKIASLHSSYSSARATISDRSGSSEP